jgi:hypothetical protein
MTERPRDPLEEEITAEVVQRPEMPPPAGPQASGLMQFFLYGHLPAHLQEVSAPFSSLAWHIVTTLPDNGQRDAALVKLIEAKDCAVRARVFK